MGFLNCFFLGENMSSIRRPKHAENPSENIKVFVNLSLSSIDMNLTHLL